MLDLRNLNFLFGSFFIDIVLDSHRYPHFLHQECGIQVLRNSVFEFVVEKEFIVLNFNFKPLLELEGYSFRQKPQ